MKKLCKPHLNKLCELHKSDIVPSNMRRVNAELVTDSPKKKRSPTLKTPKHKEVKPKLSHEDMMNVPWERHNTVANTHQHLSTLYPESIPEAKKINDAHRKAAQMHHAYASAKAQFPDWDTDKVDRHKKESTEKAQKLHEDLSSMETSGHKVGDMIEHRKSEYLGYIHKNEEGAHAPHTENDVTDPCPYCTDNEDNRTDDCADCQDLDAQENADGTAGMHDCPACKEYDEVQQNAGGIDDCPYCQTENITEAQADPEKPQDHICNCPYCQNNQKDQTNVAVEDMGAERPDNCPQCQEMYGQAIENEPGQTSQGDPNLQGHETAEEVLDLLDQEPGQGAQTPAQEAKKIDNTELPQGDQMKDGTSVKEDFGDAQKDNISDSEKDFGRPEHDCNCPDCPGSKETDPMEADRTTQDEPDMTGVLKDGLDEHANDQKKQQVLEMVSQTLQGFKANKESLEATKDQNQALYNSCIQMLKSMIELCKLLGLQPKMAAPQDAGAVAEATQSDAPPGPKAAAPKEGAAGSPKSQG